MAGEGVWEQRQLRRARDLGLGRGPEAIRLRLAPGEAEFTDRLRRAAKYADIRLA